MKKYLLERIQELAGTDDDQYLYNRKPYKKVLDKMKADGVEIKSIGNGKYKVKLKLKGQFTGTQYNVNNKGALSYAILKSMLDSSDDISMMQVIKNKGQFLDYPNKPLRRKYGGLMVAIENSLNEISRDQWKEYTVPIDLTFEQIFEKGV